NEMQRNSGGDKVVVDESIYQVAIGRFGETTPDWAGLVIGPPRLYPLATVNVLAAGGTITVFNKSNRKLWQAQLIYPVPAVDNGQSSTGAGPCAERDGILYVFDAAVLTAFDPAAGNVLWRLPSIGILGLFFDQGMVYVNTTTANLNNLKYSRQIDVTRKIRSVLLKVDPKTGRIVWTSQPRGAVCYVSGPFIYASYSFDPGDVTGPEAALMGRPFLRLVRIDPGNGHVLWEYTEGRAPVDMQFDGPTIRLIFKKQVEVLHYLVL
ncbi:MAG: PQQ-binding-like beta-propeller repeat protein, partial [Verrucomicrobia bacterium]|nr:PQQ-binding-like beta-propeller repeat protein [Verrucomicrobiota bacterium]